jgi:hypothetical protein
VFAIGGEVEDVGAVSRTEVVNLERTLARPLPCNAANAATGDWALARTTASASFWPTPLSWRLRAGFFKIIKHRSRERTDIPAPHTAAPTKVRSAP